jgi:cardiolipin synthase
MMLSETHPALWITAGVVVFFVLVIWSLKRHRDPKLRTGEVASTEDAVRSLAGLSLGHAVAGNSVEIHENGAFFDVLIEEISKARHSVHFESFLWQEGELGARVAQTLSARARAASSSSSTP